MYCALLMLGACSSNGTSSSESASNTVTTPPPPKEHVVANSYQIYFDWDRAMLDAKGVKKLEDVASHLKQQQPTHPQHILINGHTDTSGRSDYNMRLSERRAHSIRTMLKQLGLADNMLQEFAFGESDLAVPTADGVKEPRNRRVELFIEDQK
jgi:OmpA-OmpF porin, OOP family